MNVQCDFSIGFDNEIEDIDMYSDVHLSKRMVRTMLTDLVTDGTIVVRERTTGSVSYDVRNDRVTIESRSCVDLGVEYDSDNWEDNPVIHFPNDRIKI